MFGVVQALLKSSYDALGDSVLQRKEVVLLNVVAVCPHLQPRRCITQLRADPKSRTRAANTTVKDIANAQFIADLTGIYGPAAIDE